jgi:hypothetical protein
MKHKLQKDNKDNRENPDLRRTAGDKKPDQGTDDDRPVIKHKSNE